MAEAVPTVAPEPEKPPKPTLKRVLTILAIALLGGPLLVFIAFYGYRSAVGSDVGGKCEDLLGCKPGGTCISKRCYQGCKEDSDCPPRAHCGAAKVKVTRRGSTSLGDERSESEEKICFPHKQE